MLLECCANGMAGTDLFDLSEPTTTKASVLDGARKMAAGVRTLTMKEAELFCNDSRDAVNTRGQHNGAVLFVQQVLHRRRFTPLAPPSTLMLLAEVPNPALFSEGKEQVLYPIEPRLAAILAVYFVACAVLSCKPATLSDTRAFPCIDCPGDETTSIPFRKVAALVVVLDLTRIEAAALPQGFDRTRKVCVVLPTAPQHWEGCDSIPTYINIPTEILRGFLETGQTDAALEHHSALRWMDEVVVKLVREGMCFVDELVAKMAPYCEEHARWMDSVTKR